MPQDQQRDVWRPAIIIAVGTWLTGLLIAFAAALLSGPSSIVAAARSAGRAMVLAVGSPLHGAGFDITVVPLGGTISLVIATLAFTRWQGRAGYLEPGLLGACAGAVAAILAAITSVASNAGTLSTSVIVAAVGGFVVVGAASGLYQWFSTRPTTELTTGSILIAAAMRMIVPLFLAGFIVLLIRLAVTGDEASTIWASLNPGFVGSMSLAGLHLMVLPNAVTWTVALMIGPGFLVGADTSVDLSGADIAELPAFPMLAALPSAGPAPGWLVVLALIPLLCAVWGGWNAAVRSGADDVWAVVVHGALAGMTASAGLALMMWLSAGSIGPGAMSQVGPVLGPVTAISFGIFTVGGAVGAALAHYRGARA